MSDEKEPLFEIPDSNGPSNDHADPGATDVEGIPAGQLPPGARPDPTVASPPLRVARPDRPKSENPAPPVAAESAQADPATETDPVAGQDLAAAAPEEQSFEPEVEVSGNNLIIFAVLLAIAFLFGAVIYYKTALPTLLLAMVLGTGLPRLLAGWKLSPWRRTGILFGLVAALHIAGVFIMYPLWTANRDNFGKAVVAAAARLDTIGSSDESDETETAAETEHEPEAEDPPPDEDTAVPAADANNTVAKLAGNVMALVSDVTELALWQKLALLGQLLSFSAFFLYVPLFIRAASPGIGRPTAGDGPGLRTRVGAFCLNLVHKSGRFSIVRIAKALLMGLLTATGFLAGGLAGWWFAAVTVALLAAFCNLAPALAAVLGLLVVFESSAPVRGIIALVITTIVLILAEKKLFWYMHLIPLSKRYNLPPEMLAPPKGDKMKYFRWIPSAISLVVMALICFVAWQFFIVQQQSVDRTNHLYKGRQALSEKRTEDAAEHFASIMKHNPNDKEAMVGLLQVRLQKQDFGAAYELAEKLENWKPSTPTAPTNRVQAYIAEFTGSVPQHEIGKSRGYEIILKQTAMLADQGALHEKVAGRLDDLRPDSMWPHYARGLVNYHAGDYDQALEHIDQALEADPENETLMLMKAETLYELDEYAKSRAICAKLRLADPENKAVQDLLARLNLKRNQP